jgi:uncharacterized membrane protein YphA (DoxX/SURF4 family)
MNWRTILLGSRATGWSILVRLLVGLVVFFPEGIQKLAFPDILGAGRFATIGIPYPNLMGPFVGGIETICGALIVLGLFTRLASIPLIVIMIVAIVSTKLPILLEHDARGPRRFLHAAGLDLFAARRRRSVVVGRSLVHLRQQSG